MISPHCKLNTSSSSLKVFISWIRLFAQNKTWVAEKNYSCFNFCFGDFFLVSLKIPKSSVKLYKNTAYLKFMNNQKLSEESVLMNSKTLPYRADVLIPRKSESKARKIIHRFLEFLLKGNFINFYWPKEYRHIWLS